MATIKYLIKLIPHDKFFFGGENTFGENNHANYYVVSNYFPQQTGTLGLIRHQLLLQCNDETIFKDNKIVDKSSAKKLIGAKSFVINGGNDFGKIKALSPVFICNANTENANEDYYFPANKEYHWHEKLDDDGNKKTINEFLQICIKPDPLLRKYDAKFGLPDLLINKQKNRLKYEDVFKEHKQIGIRKKYEGGTDDKAYYIQTFYKFHNSFCFAFIVELDKDASFSSQDIVTFGAEQQAFKMEVSEYTEESKQGISVEELFNVLIPEYEKSNNSDKVVLISDAYTTEDIMQECDFAITETVDFRFLETKTDSGKNYYSKPTKSEKHNLYKKGSVFYGDTDKITCKLDNKQFKDIGYNIYKVIKS